MEIPTASSYQDVAVGILYWVRKILGIFTCIKRIKNNMPVLLKNRSKAIYKAEKGRILQKIAIVGVWGSDYLHHNRLYAFWIIWAIKERRRLRNSMYSIDSKFSGSA